MIPRLELQNGKTVLLVEGKPFIMLAGEVHNSSSSSAEYMEPIWQKLREMKLNSVLMPITWQLIEPEEGKFDFTLVDALLEQARRYEMKIGFLWFGTWKNAQCSYVPNWVKQDPERFKRAEVQKGKRFVWLTSPFYMPYTTLSALCEETKQADANAFRMLMRHLKQVDSEENTVIMVQVENEVGFLGSGRERSDLADALFAGEAPRELVNFMRENADTLADDIRENLKLGAECGSWQAVFGENAEEIFSAYSIASYVEYVAAAGKEEYPLPMAVNCWLDRDAEVKPGYYPSGGPVARMMEVWKYTAPSVDIYAPDIYLPNFCEICEKFVKLGNPLFIPEAAAHSKAAARQVYVVGRHHAMCYSPFGIEDLGEKQNYEMGEMMGVDTADPALKHSQNVKQYTDLNDYLQQIMPLLTERYGTPKLQAVIQEDAERNTMSFGSYKFYIMYEHPMIWYKDGVCMILQLQENEFLVLGCGCSVDFISMDEKKPYGEFLTIEEGLFEDGKWKMLRMLNGDEEHIWLNQPTLLRVKLHLYGDA